MVVVGLTGGVATGKTTLSKYLSGFTGCTVIDADKLGHHVYEKGSKGYHQLVDAFTRTILAADDSVDRAKLRGVVFNDKAALKRLTDITWPLIRVEAEHQIKELSHRNKLVILEAAVLVEANWQTIVDEVWVLESQVNVKRDRLRTTRGWLTEGDIDAILSSQLKDADRTAALQATGSRYERVSTDAAIDDSKAAIAALARRVGLTIAAADPVPPQ